jgi:hypothetical protein
MVRDKKEKAHINFFGEDYTQYEKNNRPGSVVWGIFVLFAGVILLLNTLHLVPWNFWDTIWKFWPLLFILAGIHIIFGKNSASRLIMAILTILLFTYVVIYGLVQIGSPLIRYFPPNLISNIIYFGQMKR